MNKCSLVIVKLLLTVILLSSSSISRKTKTKSNLNSRNETCKGKQTWKSVIIKAEKEGDCKTSIDSDFKSRESQEKHYTECDNPNSFGPWAKLFPQASVPKSCNKEDWARERILKAIDLIVKKKYNYCHHHSPQWSPPKDTKYRSVLDSTKIAEDGSKGVCSGAYFAKGENPVNNDAGWRGTDCSGFSSFTYNFSFGAYLDTNIHKQACDNTKKSRAVSSYLPFTKDDQDKFKVGDLLYIAKNGSANPLSVSHVIMWTGYKLGDPGFSEEDVIKNIDPAKHKAFKKAIKQNLDAKKPVYIIADSHFIGPNYRPFVSWYYTAFTHARRVIGKEEFDKEEPKKGTELTASACNVPK